MMFNSANEVKAYLWDKLNLDDHAITFHVVEGDDNDFYFAPGIVMTIDDFEESDAASVMFEAHYDENEIEVFGVDSYMIGDGESDHADYSDIKALEEVNTDSTDAMSAFLHEFADVLATLRYFSIENPEYDDERGDDGDE